MISAFRRAAAAVSFVCLAGHGWQQPCRRHRPCRYRRQMGADAAPGGGLETITVTARKTKENLQDTPISITAITGTGLEQRGITQIDKIQDFTPNLTFQNVPSNSGVASNAAIYIRGIGQNDFAPSVDPGVGIYVDGIYMGRSVGGVFDAIDLGSVEVLRGPQGTLFGRNTIGGAVNITSMQPTDQWTGKADMKFGTGGRANVRGVVSGPITDTLSFKLAGGIFSQDGYVNAPYQGHKLGNQDTKSIKGALTWKPTSKLDVTIAADYMKDDSYGPAVVVTGINQSAYAAGSSLVFLNNLLAMLGKTAPPTARSF
jgi:iron complex outermembrane receptor protein